MKEEWIDSYRDLDVRQLVMRGAFTFFSRGVAMAEKRTVAGDSANGAPFHRFTGSPFRLKPHLAVGWP
jgi:hypothetical protein